jgi:hypothetical protein
VQPSDEESGVESSAGQPREPDKILRDLLELDPGLRLETYYGEQAIFYNPAGAAPLGAIFAAIKDHDGPNDRSAELSRAGVYRLAFGLTRGTFAQRFGHVPARPPKGAAVALPGYDLTRLGKLLPHPVYAWMSWVQILSPTTTEFESLRPLLAESLELAQAKWKRRKGHPHATQRDRTPTSERSSG